MNEEIMKDMFNELERWYNNDYVTLDMYFRKEKNK